MRPAAEGGIGSQLPLGSDIRSGPAWPQTRRAPLGRPRPAVFAQRCAYLEGLAGSQVVSTTISPSSAQPRTRRGPTPASVSSIMAPIGRARADKSYTDKTRCSQAQASPGAACSGCPKSHHTARAPAGRKLPHRAASSPRRANPGRLRPAHRSQPAAACQVRRRRRRRGARLAATSSAPSTRPPVGPCLTALLNSSVTTRAASVASTGQSCPLMAEVIQSRISLPSRGSALKTCQPGPRHPPMTTAASLRPEGRGADATSDPGPVRRAVRSGDRSRCSRAAGRACRVQAGRMQECRDALDIERGVVGGE